MSSEKDDQNTPANTVAEGKQVLAFPRKHTIFRDIPDDVYKICERIRQTETGEFLCKAITEYKLEIEHHGIIDDDGNNGFSVFSESVGYGSEHKYATQEEFVMQLVQSLATARIFHALNEICEARTLEDGGCYKNTESRLYFEPASCIVRDRHILGLSCLAVILTAHQLKAMGDIDIWSHVMDSDLHAMAETYDSFTQERASKSYLSWLENMEDLGSLDEFTLQELEDNLEEMKSVAQAGQLYTLTPEDIHHMAKAITPASPLGLNFFKESWIQFANVTDRDHLTRLRKLSMRLDTIATSRPPAALRK